MPTRGSHHPHTSRLTSAEDSAIGLIHHGRSTLMIEANETASRDSTGLTRALDGLRVAALGTIMHDQWGRPARYPSIIQWQDYILDQDLTPLGRSRQRGILFDANLFRGDSCILRVKCVLDERTGENDYAKVGFTKGRYDHLLMRRPDGIWAPIEWSTIEPEYYARVVDLLGTITYMEAVGEVVSVERNIGVVL